MIDLRLVEQFYYREARFLDARQFKQWFKICSQRIEYIIPNRSTPLPMREQQGSEDFHSLDKELSGESADESPLRVENYFSLALRTDRLLKRDSWSENPPACTRRFITNIELIKTGPDSSDKTILLYTASNFLLYYNRHQQQHLYAGQRRDVLCADVSVADTAGVADTNGTKGALTDDANKIEHFGLTLLKREVVLDWNLIAAPTVGLLF